MFGELLVACLVVLQTHGPFPNMRLYRDHVTFWLHTGGATTYVNVEVNWLEQILFSKGGQYTCTHNLPASNYLWYLHGIKVFAFHFKNVVTLFGVKCTLTPYWNARKPTRGLNAFARHCTWIYNTSTKYSPSSPNPSPHNTSLFYAFSFTLHLY